MVTDREIGGAAAKTNTCESELSAEQEEEDSGFTGRSTKCLS